MIIELKDTKVELKVSTEVAEKVDPVELAELIVASGMMEAANAAGVDPLAALDAVLNTPDAFADLLNGQSGDAFGKILDGLGGSDTDLGFGTGIPDFGPDFGDGSGLPGQNGHDFQDNGTGSGQSGVIDIFDTPRPEGQGNGDPTYDHNNKIDGMWKNGQKVILVEPRYDGEGNLVGWEHWNGEYESVADLKAEEKEAKEKEPETPATTGTDPADKPTDGEGAKPEEKKKPEGSDGDTPPKSKEDKKPPKADDEASTTPADGDGTTQPGTPDGEGGLPDNFDFGDLDDLDETTQPGLNNDGGSGVVVTVNGPGYGQTQPGHDEVYYAPTFNADVLDPTYGTTQPGLDENFVQVDDFSFM